MKPTKEELALLLEYTKRENTHMITATEARALAESQLAIEQKTKYINEKIKALAECGYYSTEACIQSEKVRYEVITKLLTEGYDVQYSDMDGDMIKISWSKEI